MNTRNDETLVRLKRVCRRLRLLRLLYFVRDVIVIAGTAIVTAGTLSLAYMLFGR